MAFSKKILQEMFDGRMVSDVLPYPNLSSRPVMEEIASGNGHISISGVQPKYGMVVDNGVLRFTKDKEQGTYMLKPAPTATYILDRAYCPANEFLTMQIASRVYGIETAKCALCRFENGEEAYLTRRFDVREDGGKYAQEDFASIAQLNKDNAGPDYKYNRLSYEECADLIRQHSKAAPIQILRFFQLVVFNYLTLNDDAHLKNFSLIQRRPGDAVLTPAYDLMNTSLHLSQPTIFALRKGLFREGMIIDDTHSVTRASFEEFGRRMGLDTKIVNRELTRFATEYVLADQMIEESHLSEKLKVHYKSSYHYRRHSLEQ